MSKRFPAVSADGLSWRLLEDVERIPSRDTSAFSYDPCHLLRSTQIKSDQLSETS